ncbi:MAG: hypothetical protein R3E77_11740 [Steroidobacteraceae bacterium]
MGQEVIEEAFTVRHHTVFRERLRDETKHLKRWFDERRFAADSNHSVGIELEAWLVDADHMPTPQNASFIAACGDERVVPELSRFNFELNVAPQVLQGRCLTGMHDELRSLWTQCDSTARQLSILPVAIGTLPTIRDDMLQPDWMSDSARYRALGQELMRLRGEKPLHVRIEGDDILDLHCNHIMLEAACTSLQVHLQVNQDDAVDCYNAAILGAAPLLAAATNSPFLYGRSLWAETRIPAFEQATAAHGFRDAHGNEVLRVTLGSGYLRKSMFELFLENLAYPALLPSLDENCDRLGHLRLHNGTIWRWNRPIIGYGADGQAHLRIEHRVMPAGPSVDDTMANVAFCCGLTLAIADDETPAEQLATFEQARQNFYRCARFGLEAEVIWRGSTTRVQQLLHGFLLPAAREALARRDIARSDLDYYFDDILLPRILSGRTGSTWQRAFRHTQAASFQALTERYVHWQRSGVPVHTWTI